MKLKDICSLEKSYDQPRQHIKKQRHYFANKIHLVKTMIFPSFMYECESWTIKKAEYPKIDDFELWLWRRLLRVPWTASRSSQSILKKISPECSLEGLMLKLKLQCFGHLMSRTDSMEKILMLGPIEGRRRRGRQRMRWLDGITTQWTWVWVAPRVGDGQGVLACSTPWVHKVLDWVTNWTNLNFPPHTNFSSVFNMQLISELQPTSSHHHSFVFWIISGFSYSVPSCTLYLSVMVLVTL